MTNAKHIELLEQAKAHYAADMLLKGTYGDKIGGEFRGCSVGCHLTHIKPELDAYQISDLSDKHKIVADYYGYPEWLALLQDTIFEGLLNGESAKWHVQLAEAIASRGGIIDWQETLHRVHIGREGRCLTDLLRRLPFAGDIELDLWRSGNDGWQ